MPAATAAPTPTPTPNPGMLAATGARLDLLDLSAVGPMAGGVWEDGNGTLGGAGQCDAAFSQPIHCLDSMLAEQSQVSRRSP